MLPEFTQAVKDNIKHMINGVHTAFPGRIEKYDPDKNLANVQPVMKYKKPNGDLIDYPLLTGVPVWFPQAFGQKSTIVYPVKAGDECLVMIAERPIDYWMLGHETKTDLMFDLTEAICIPGLFAKSNPLAKKAFDDEAIIIQLEDTFVEIKRDEVRVESKKKVIVNALNEVDITAPEIKLTGHVTVDGDVDVSGDVTADGISLKTHTHTDSVGGETSEPT